MSHGLGGIIIEGVQDRTGVYKKKLRCELGKKNFGGEE